MHSTYILRLYSIISLPIECVKQTFLRVIVKNDGWSLIRLKKVILFSSIARKIWKPGEKLNWVLSRKTGHLVTDWWLTAADDLDGHGLSQVTYSYQKGFAWWQICLTFCKNRFVCGQNGFKSEVFSKFIRSMFCSKAKVNVLNSYPNVWNHWIVLKWKRYRNARSTDKLSGKSEGRLNRPENAKANTLLDMTGGILVEANTNGSS